MSYSYPMTASDMGAKVTFTDGRVEFRVGFPSAIAREVRETDPGAIVAPRRVSEFPVEFGGKADAPIAVEDIVTVVHIGIRKSGRVVKVGRTRVHVEVAVGRGTTRRTKVIVRPIAEVRR